MASRSSKVQQPCFFEKLFCRILKKPAYAEIIEWRGDGVLLIYDEEAFKRAVEEEGISDGTYNSITRQLRIYGFNRVLGKKGRALSEEAVTAWTHKTLNATSGLQEIRAFERCAIPKSKQGATTGRPATSTKPRRKLLVPDVASSTAPLISEHDSEVEEAEEEQPNQPSFTFPIEFNAPGFNQEENTTGQESMENDETKVSAVDISQYLRETEEIGEMIDQLMKSSDTAPREDFCQYIRDIAQADEESSNEGSSFDDTYDDIIAVNAKARPDELQFPYPGHPFTVADGGLFYRNDRELF